MPRRGQIILERQERGIIASLNSLNAPWYTYPQRTPARPRAAVIREGGPPNFTFTKSNLYNSYTGDSGQIRTERRQCHRNRNRTLTNRPEQSVIYETSHEQQRTSEGWTTQGSGVAMVTHGSPGIHDDVHSGRTFTPNRPGSDVGIQFPRNRGESNRMIHEGVTERDCYVFSSEGQDSSAVPLDYSALDPEGAPPAYEDVVTSSDRLDIAAHQITSHIPATGLNSATYPRSNVNYSWERFSSVVLTFSSALGMSDLCNGFSGY